MTEWIWVTRWEDFQHYKPSRDRGPAWIKTYCKQLDDDRYLSLTDRQRALLGDVRVIFATMRGRMADDTRTIAARRRCHTRDADLKALCDAGFIEVVSRATLDQRLDQLYSRVRERRREEQEPTKHGLDNGPLHNPELSAYDWDHILKPIPD